jgi:hypothetical protein
MTVQFSRQAIAALSGSLVKTGAGLVRRLVRARNDPGKERIRKWLIDLDDAQLQSGLGLTLEDIAVLRDGTSRTCQTEIYRRDLTLAVSCGLGPQTPNRKISGE